jgi:signal peptidase I, archaeal type
LVNFLRRFFDIVLVILTTIVFIIFLLRIFGFSPYIILGGSMEPSYKIGSLIYVKNVDAKEVQVNDVITYVANKNLDIVTHRVIEIDDKNSEFYTKGDANQTIDAETVHFNNLIGIPKFSVPYIGYVVMYLVKKPEIYLFIIAVVIMSIVLEFPRKITDVKRKGEKI